MHREEILATLVSVALLAPCEHPGKPQTRRLSRLASLFAKADPDTANDSVAAFPFPQKNLHPQEKPEITSGIPVLKHSRNEKRFIVSSRSDER
jgi:hypothetical protein